MKKTLNWVIAATLVCGATTVCLGLNSCKEAHADEAPSSNILYLSSRGNAVSLMATGRFTPRETACCCLCIYGLPINISANIPENQENSVSPDLTWLPLGLQMFIIKLGYNQQSS